MELVARGCGGQLERLVVGIGDRDGADRADVLSQLEGEAVLLRLLLVHAAPVVEPIGKSLEDPRHDSPLRAVQQGLLAQGEGGPDGRVWVLVRAGADPDLPDDPVVVDLSVAPVLARPVGRRPALDPLLVGVGNLIVLAVVIEGVLGPGLSNDLQMLVVPVAIREVARGLVPPRLRDALPQNLHPPLLIPAREADGRTPLRELIEDRHVLGDPDGVGGGQHDRHRRELDLLRTRSEVREQKDGIDGELAALGVEVVLGRGEGVDAELVRQDDELAELLEHHLVPLGIPADRTELLPLLERRGNGGHCEQVDLHDIPPSRSDPATTRPPRGVRPPDHSGPPARPGRSRGDPRRCDGSPCPMRATARRSRRCRTQRPRCPRCTR